YKLHTQTSGRSLIAAEFKNNLTRTAAELVLAYMNATNSCHSNSADEPFTTPSEEWIRLAAHGQAILLEESGLFKHTSNRSIGLRNSKRNTLRKRNPRWINLRLPSSAVKTVSRCYWKRQKFVH